jgi:hypothetical protein
MLHTAETIDLTFADGVVSTTTRIAVPGGWLYSGATAVYVPDSTALHVCDTRRLKLREGYDIDLDVTESLLCYTFGGDSVITKDRLARSFTAYHADGSQTDHASRLDAHDALIASGSESPFEVVTGPAVKS